MKQQEVGTIVGSSVHLTGAIKDTSDITIFGSVEGEVHSDQKVSVEDTAVVKGPINASVVIVSGKIIGTVNARERLELNPTGMIKGNIDTSDLLIHSGSIFIGECNMPDKKGESEETAENFEAEVEESETGGEETKGSDEEKKGKAEEENEDLE